MGKGFKNTFVSIAQTHVLSNNTNPDRRTGRVHCLDDHGFPVIKIKMIKGKLQPFQNEFIKLLFSEFNRYLIDGIFHIFLFNNSINRYVAEHGQLFEMLFLKRSFCPADKNVRNDADVTHDTC